MDDLKKDQERLLKELFPEQEQEKLLDEISPEQERLLNELFPESEFKEYTRPIPIIKNYNPKIKNTIMALKTLKKMDLSLILSVVSILFILISSITLYSHYNKLKNENDKINNENNKIKNKVNLIENKIKKTDEDIKNIKDETNERMEDLSRNMGVIQSTLETINESIKKLYTIVTGRQSASVGGETLDMRATVYDLSVESCGKTRDHPEYGITRSGVKATKNRTVAVDPKVIPLGSKLYITFPEKYKFMNGNYVAEDTGGAIKGNKIDIFLGESVDRDYMMEFGIQPVKVKLIK